MVKELNAVRSTPGCQLCVLEGFPRHANQRQGIPKQYFIGFISIQNWLAENWFQVQSSRTGLLDLSALRIFSQPTTVWVDALNRQHLKLFFSTQKISFLKCHRFPLRSACSRRRFAMSPSWIRISSRVEISRLSHSSSPDTEAGNSSTRRRISSEASPIRLALVISREISKAKVKARVKVTTRIHDHRISRRAARSSSMSPTVGSGRESSD